MLQELNQAKNDFDKKIIEVSNLQDLEEIRISLLGKKGLISTLFQTLRNFSGDQKKDFGSILNETKNQIINEINLKKEALEISDLNKKLEEQWVDLTQEVREENQGLIHPISQVINEVEDIFGNMGFVNTSGPEIEDDFHNFSALNIDENHPARQMQDTFYLKNNNLLRTHTSSVQIRKMLDEKAPIKIVSIGKVYRKDSDQTHTPMFHQAEALYVDENVNMSNLKWTLEQFLQRFFETDDVSMRFRPSFFPFTEPSAELDIGFEEKENQIKIGGNKNYMEILGCGMVHPNVLENVGIDSKKYQGFAFGVGIERLAMLKYGINDLRMFFENDIRFLRHFGFMPN